MESVASREVCAYGGFRSQQIQPKRSVTHFLQPSSRARCRVRESAEHQGPVSREVDYGPAGMGVCASTDGGPRHGAARTCGVGAFIQETAELIRENTRKLRQTSLFIE
jgi:hypothetical protein